VTATAEARPEERSGGRLGRHPNVAAALVSLVLAAIMVGPGLVPGRVLSSSDIWWPTTPWAADLPPGFDRPANPDLQDAARAFQPLREEVKHQLPDVPLWDPWIASGRPLLADGQSAVFSVFTLPAYVMPLQDSLAWTALLTLWAATFGMYLLARALGMRFAGALMAGVVFGLNLWLVAWVSYPHSGVWALLPWVLWGTERLVRRPSATATGVLAFAVGAQFLAGHPESSFHVVLAAVAFFVLRLGLLLRREPEARLRPRVLAMVAALVAGTALAAMLLVPFAELLLHSSDLHARSGTGVDVHVDPQFLLGFFLFDYWGRATNTALTPPFLFSRAWYVGALPLMLAAAALVIRPRADEVSIAAGGGFLIAVIFGVPPFGTVASRIPPFNLGHNDRLIVVVLACLALLAGFGLDKLCARAALTRRGRQAVLLSAAAVLLLPLLMVMVLGDVDELFPATALKVALKLADPPGAADPAAGDVIRLGAILLWLILAGAGCLLLLLRVRGLPARTFAGFAIALVVADLLRAGMGYNPAIPKEHADQPITGSLQYLLAQRPGRFVGLGDVPQNVPALRQRLPDARGNDPPILERYNRLWRREVSPEFPDQTATLESPFLQVPRVDERRLRTLRLLGVTHLLVPPRTPPDELRAPGLRQVYSGPDARVYRVENALPRTFVAAAQRTVDGAGAALDAVTDASLNRRQVVVTERRLPGVPGTQAGAAAGTAKITSYEPDRVSIDARLTRPGVVVLGDNWFPGWKAEVDGRPARVERVDYVLRGVVVGTGPHRVEFRYEPASWRMGWIISLLSLAAIAAGLLISRRRRTR
jgi:hypothetical protein